MLYDLALYDQMLYEKRREASQATLDAFFSKASLPEASACYEPPASDKPHPCTSTGGIMSTNIPLSSDTDNPDVV